MVLKSLQPAATPLANYVRLSRRDHRFLLDLAAEEALPGGLVVDPTLWDLQAELADEARRQQVEVIFDPQGLELATQVRLWSERDGRLAVGGCPSPHTSRSIAFGY